MNNADFEITVPAWVSALTYVSQKFRESLQTLVVEALVTRREAITNRKESEVTAAAFEALIVAGDAELAAVKDGRKKEKAALRAAHAALMSYQGACPCYDHDET